MIRIKRYSRASAGPSNRKASRPKSDDWDDDEDYYQGPGSVPETVTELDPLEPYFTGLVFEDGSPIMAIPPDPIPIGFLWTDAEGRTRMKHEFFEEMFGD